MVGSFGKDLIIYGFSSSIGKFVSLLLVPLFTRVFIPDIYGEMDMILTIVAIASIFGMVQLESAVSRYFYTQKDELGKKIIISTAFWSVSFLSLFIVLLAVVFSDKISSFFFDNPRHSFAIILSSLIIPVSNLNSLFTVVIRFKKKPVHYMFFQLLQIIITVGVTIFLITYLKIGIIGVFWGQLVGYSIATFMMAIYLKNYLSFIWNKVEFKKMIRFSLPLVPAVAGGWANSYLNRFIILGYLSVADLGLYAVALKIASVFQLVGSALRMAWGPFLWETFENNSNHKVVFRKIQKELSLFVFILVVIITLFSKEIILLVASDAYMPATQLIGFIAISLAISEVIIPITSIGPGITKKTEYNTVIFFLSIPVNIGALLFLVPKIGVIAVPISLFFANLVFLIAGWWNSERLYYIGFKIYPMIFNLIFSLLIISLILYFEVPISIKIILSILPLLYMVFKYKTQIIKIKSLFYK